ncbi:MAG: trypsin-like peptidase domain-containing protein [Nakamurella sp.]
MSNDITGAPDPQSHPTDEAGATQFPSPDRSAHQPDAPIEQNAWFFGAHDARQADSDVPELDENDPLLRSRGPSRGAPQVESHPQQGHPAITPTPIPHQTGGVPAAPMPQTGGGQYAPRPMPQQQPSGFQPHPGYPGSWNGNGWQPGQHPYNGSSQTVTATPPAVAGTHRRRSGALVAGALVLALGAGLGGGYLGADLRQTNSGTALTASSVSRTLTQSAAPTTAAASGTIESVAAAVLPSVVSVLATSSASAGEGSGVILTTDGYILTNNHVVEGATDLTVRFNDGTTTTATLVGADTTGDLAVIKVDGVSGLTPAALGSSSAVKVGQQVVAIGSPLGLSATVTSGIVSALNRPVRTTSPNSQQPQQQNPFGQQQQQSTAATAGTVLNAVQTDAAINPGNSGGALVNMQGQIIGINSAIASLSSGSSESGSIGVGFAIPIDTASRIAQEIIDTGKASHAVLGASVADSAGSGTIPIGAEIQQVTSGGAAEAAGLQVGDVVTKIDDNLIESADALVATIRSAAPNSKVQITVLRGSSTETLDVTLGSAAS